MTAPLAWQIGDNVDSGKMRPRSDDDARSGRLPAGVNIAAAHLHSHN